MVERVVTKQLAGVEDLALGHSTVNQARQSGTVPITQINATSIPFADYTEDYGATNVHAALMEVMAAALVNEADILSLSASIDTLLTELDIPNSSFEVADDVIPTRAADWTTSSIYTGATLALDTNDSNHGDKSYKFTSTGSGGAVIASQVVPCKPSKIYLFSFDIKSSVVDVRNWVRVHWYTDDGSFVSETYLYDDSTTNPLTWTTKRAFATAPATATQFIFQVAGCASSDPTPGSTWIDGITFFDTSNHLTSIGANIASAATLPVNITGTYHYVTGTFPIVALAAVRVGEVKYLEFQSALSLVHSASLILPGLANITTAAGDKAIFMEVTSGNWKCLSYQRAANSPDKVSAGAWEKVSSTGLSVDATYDITGLGSDYAEYKIVLEAVRPSAVLADLLLRVGTGATPTWDAGANYDSHTHTMSAGSSAYLSTIVNNGSAVNLANSPLGAALDTDDYIHGEIYFWRPHALSPFIIKADLRVSSETGGSITLLGYTTYGGYEPSVAVTAVRLLFSTGSLNSGTIDFFRRKIT